MLLSVPVTFIPPFHAKLLTDQFSIVKKSISRQRLANPPNPLFKGEFRISDRVIVPPDWEDSGR